MHDKNKRIYTTRELTGFIASRLTNPDIFELGEKIYQICCDLGYKVFLPQHELPLDTECTPLQILTANEAGVTNADFLIVVFDEASTGTAMELERGFTLGKIIIGYRSDEHQESEELGKMLQGAWDRIPQGCRAGNLAELREILAEKL